MNFRNDVEGLRAVAVLPILLFHAGFTQFKGGFVGVDIFFVISGFLITKIIKSGLESGNFSILNFYSRRAVRILPLLCVILVLSFAAGMIFLYPSARANLAESSIYTILFVSNMYFWRNIDYFRPDSEYSPLLHTWSLGVEEQFYIFYPVFLMLLCAWVKPRLARNSIVILLCAASFALALWLSMAGKDRTAFYLLPSRAWELGIGALVALNAVPMIVSRPVRTGLCILAFAAIAGSVLLIEPNFGFPAPWALVPCIATAILIAYAPATRVENWLSWAPLRSIGRVSYAIYLWHWPIIVFYKIHRGYHLSTMDTGVSIALTLFAAYASTYLLERPLIRRFGNHPGKPVLAVAGIACAALAMLGFAIQRNPGSLSNYGPEIARILAFEDYQQSADYRSQFRPGHCFISTSDRPADSACKQLDNVKPNVIVVGDSLAAQYWRAYQDRFPQYNLIQATAPGCRPLIDAVGDKLCRANVDDVLNRLVPSGQVKTVVLSGSWQKKDVAGLEATIRHIMASGVRVVLIGPSLVYDASYPVALADAVAKNDEGLLDKLRNKDSLPVRDEMRAIAGRLGVAFASPIDILCPDGKCRLYSADGSPSHFDGLHLTLPAAREVVSGFPAP